MLIVGHSAYWLVYSKSLRCMQAFIMLLCILTSLVGCTASSTPVKRQVTPTPSVSSKGTFRVQGNKIYDPDGKPFIVKGVVAIYGRFMDQPNTLGVISYQNARRDLDAIKRMGVNVVRIFISAHYASLPPSDPDYLPDYMQEVDNVVRWTTQRGMVAYLANSQTANFNTSLRFVSQLAAHYKNNPYVWLQPMNEPNCDRLTGDPSQCFDWQYWQTQQTMYVQAIRKAGMTSPIVVNTINYSWDLSEINNYPLPDSNIIYGAHRYANDNVNFTSSERADCDNKWANLAQRFPIIVDEVGAYSSVGDAVHPAWNQGFIDYVTNWVNTRGGLGAIGFVYYWVSESSMTGNARENISNGVLTQWGKLFYDSYLKKVAVSK